MARDPPVNRLVSAFDSSSDEESSDDEHERPRVMPPRPPTPFAHSELSGVPVLMPSPELTGSMGFGHAPLPSHAVYYDAVHDPYVSGLGDEHDQAQPHANKGAFTPEDLRELQTRLRLARETALANRREHEWAYQPRTDGRQDRPVIEEERFRIYRDEMFAKFYYDHNPADGVFPNGAKEMNEAGLVPEYVEPEQRISYFDNNEDEDEEDDGSMTPAPPPTPHPRHAQLVRLERDSTVMDVDEGPQQAESFVELTRQSTPIPIPGITSMVASSRSAHAAHLHNSANSTNSSQARSARPRRHMPREYSPRPRTVGDERLYLEATALERSLQGPPPTGPESVPRSMRGATYTVPARIEDNPNHEHVLPVDWMTISLDDAMPDEPIGQQLQLITHVYPPRNVHYTTDPPRGPDWEDPEGGSSSS